MPTRRRPSAAPRRGAVLLVVLLVVVILSLAAYQYSEWMTAEYRAADSYGRSQQARASAESAIHYTAALLSNPTTLSQTLNGNPWDNATAFQNIAVDPNATARVPRFSVVALRDPDDPDAASQPFRFGVSDEAGKINVNALLDLDGGQGNVGHDILMKLPNMTEDVANSILDWLDPDDTPRSDGAESDYYSALPVPYRAKNGPLDSLEELLLVKGVTPELLFGNDRNRNGVLDPDEDDGSGQVDRGWSAFLTVYSREPNTDSQGNARIYLNETDLNDLSEKLTTALGEDMANYIIAYRLYGGSSAGGSPAGGTAGAGAGTAGAAAGRTTTPAATPTPAPSSGAATPFRPLSGADLDDVRTQVQTARAASTPSRPPSKVGSVFDLINSSVNVPVGSGPGARTVSYPSPLNDPGQLATLLPLILDQTTTSTATDLTPRINVNTASQTVLAAIPGLEDADVQNILNARPSLSSGEPPDAIFQTPTWLLTEANLPASKVKSIEQYITARTQVYRFQVLGYFDGGGLTTRVEVVIDGNNGRPRIVYHRDLTELGPGFDMTLITGQ
jgi:type II secretory pathway component PulK